VISGLLVIVLGFAAIVVLCPAVRFANRRAEERFDAIVRSHMNVALTSDAVQAVVGAVVAVGDEMLIELRSAPEPCGRTRTGPPNELAMWVHSPANVASIITLTRWQDAQTTVDVRRQPHGVVLSNDQARVSLVRARADLVL
jgi:hypothetical protein